MNYTPLAELALPGPESVPTMEPSWSARSSYCRTEILIVGDDDVRAEPDIPRRCDRALIDDVFVVRDSRVALDVLCRLREYEYRRNDRDLRVVLVDPRIDHTDVRKLAACLRRADNVAHFPIVRAECRDDGSLGFEAVHHHEFEDLLDSMRAVCVLLWESLAMAA